MLAGHPPEVLAGFEALLADLSASMDTYIAERTEKT